MWLALASSSFEGSPLWQSPDFTSVCSLVKAKKLFSGLGWSLQKTILQKSRKCPFFVFHSILVTFIPQHLTGRTCWDYPPLSLRSFRNCLLSTISKFEFVLLNFNAYDLSKSMMPYKKIYSGYFWSQFFVVFLSFSIMLYAKHTKRHRDWWLTWNAQWFLHSSQVNFNVCLFKTHSSIE